MSKRILIVEDEMAMAKALGIKLRSAGFEVETVSNADEFFAKKRETVFDLIVLDLMLPKVSGFEILQQLNLAKNTVPIIVASNLSQEEDRIRAKNLGAADYIVKSEVSLSDVVEKVQSFFV